MFFLRNFRCSWALVARFSQQRPSTKARVKSTNQIICTGVHNNQQSAQKNKKLREEKYFLRRSFMVGLRIVLCDKRKTHSTFLHEKVSVWTESLDFRVINIETRQLYERENWLPYLSTATYLKHLVAESLDFTMLQNIVQSLVIIPSKL